MIQFFRRIRQKLITEGHLSKYMIYALGEILLVVIGILNAMQINNWNQKNIQASDEAYMLSQILDNLNEDAEQLTYIRERRMTASAGVSKILQSYETGFDAAPLDEQSLASFLTFERFYPIHNAYEMLKSQGIKLNNRSLRSSISRYYEFDQVNIKQSVADVENVFIRIMQTDNIIRKNFKKAARGTKKTASIELVDPKDPILIKAVLEELIPFQDNNESTLHKVSDLLTINQRLSASISEELKSKRLSKYLN